MNKILRGIIILFLAFPGFNAYSQENDAGLWLSVKLEKKITSALFVEFSEELRMNENITEAGTIFSDLGLGYKFWKRFRVSANFRFINKRRLDDSYDKRIRYYFEFTYREKVNPLIFQLRLRFQSQYTEIFTSPEGKVPDNAARARLKIKLDLNKKIEPYIYSESFFRLNSPDGILFINARYCAGIEYSFNRYHMIDFFYMVQKEYNVKNPGTDFIIGAGYNFTLPDFKTKHKGEVPE